MNNLKQKHKDYLIKNEIKDLTDLVNYVEILRNTSNLKGEDRQMLFDFAFLITNEQLSLKSFFAENKNKMGCSPTPSKEFYNTFKQNTSSPTLLEKIIFDVCDKIDKGEWEGFKNDGFIFENPIQSVEEINNSPTFMDEVLDSNTTVTEAPNFNESVGFQMKRCRNIIYKPTQQSGVKETENKTDYSEIDFDILDLMAERFNANKHKYPKGNMLKPIDEKELLFAGFRHLKKMIQPIEGDEETFLQHLSSVLCNMQMVYQQIKLKKC